MVTDTPGMTRKRNRSVASEKAAMFAHLSLPCLPSRYALTEARVAYWANARKSIHEPEIVEAAVLANQAWRLVKDKL